MRQVALAKPTCAIHLGDVYYAGRAEEFSKNFADPARAIMDASELFVLPGNHEGYSGGGEFHNFLHVQNKSRQAGLDFCLRNDQLQLIGLDTEWSANADDDRVLSDEQLAWLMKTLAQGKEDQLINVLLTSNEPCNRAGSKLTKLGKQLTKLKNGLPEMWVWGNEHYGALLKPPELGDCLGCCVGFGGFPYRRIEAEKNARESSWWTELNTRFHDNNDEKAKWDVYGNNGFGLLEVAANKPLGLQFIDWRGQLLARFDLAWDRKTRKLTPIKS